MKPFLLILIAMTSSLASDLRVTVSPQLQKSLNVAVSNTLALFAPKLLKPEELAISLWQIGGLQGIQTAASRGEIGIYPASVVKLFYLAAAHRWLEDGKIADTPELKRALHNMIVDSSNDATHYVVDLLTGTTGGPELSPPEMTAWAERRNVINRYFAAEGYRSINVNQKPWDEGPYGRERVFVGANYENRNALTTEATARLLCEIALGRAVTRDRSAQMLELLRRDVADEGSKPDDQTQAFTASALPAGSKLWSKAGWTSKTRHDAAYIELPGGQRIILVIFTLNHAPDREIIPALVRQLLPDLQAK